MCGTHESSHRGPLDDHSKIGQRAICPFGMIGRVTLKRIQRGGPIHMRLRLTIPALLWDVNLVAHIFPSRELPEGAQPSLLNSIGPSTAATALPPIPAPPFLNRDGPVDPHNDVINQGNANHFSRLLQSLCHADILIAGSRIATRMIMNSNDAVRCIPDRRAKHFSRMDQAVPERPHCNLVTVNRCVLCVQRDDPEFFLLTLTSQPAESLEAELYRCRWTGYPC